MLQLLLDISFPGMENSEKRITVSELRQKLEELETSNWGDAIVHVYENEQAAGLSILLDIDNPDGEIFIRTGP